MAANYRTQVGIHPLEHNKLHTRNASQPMTGPAARREGPQVVVTRAAPSPRLDERQALLAPSDL